MTRAICLNSLQKEAPALPDTVRTEHQTTNDYRFFTLQPLCSAIVRRHFESETENETKMRGFPVNGVSTG